MMVTLVLGASVLLRFIAVFLALRLLRITGRRSAWALIATAISLMAIRRLIPLFRLISGDLSHPPDLRAELAGLATSVLMVVGIAWIAPLFYSVKRQEEALKKSELKIRLITENMRDTVFVYDMNRQLQYVNPAFETLTGYTIKELYQKDFINYIHPDDEKKNDKTLGRIVSRSCLHRKRISYHHERWTDKVVFKFLESII